VVDPPTEPPLPLTGLGPGGPAGGAENRINA